MPRARKSERVPRQMQPTFNAITALTDQFCQEHLNQEYAQLAHQAAAALCRKRPSPLLKGQDNTWACGIIYALGFVNFLFDPSQQPHMSAGELCDRFGVSRSTGSTRSKAVRNALNMIQLDPAWCLPSKLEQNPLAWLVEVNGLVVDARSMPREIQEEAHQKGLIPYIPERVEDTTEEPPILDRRLMERQLRAMGQLLEQQSFESIEEMNAFLQETAQGGQLEWTPETPLERAQELVYQAMATPNRGQRLRLAQQALEVSPDCADAYVFLADEQAESPEQALQLYRQGMEAGERSLGPEMFTEGVGEFWGIVETRPYMRAREGVARCLWILGEREEAVGHFREMLRLNPGDNQGIRYHLLGCLLRLDDVPGADELLGQYPDEGSATWGFTRALVSFLRKGDTPESRQALEAAMEQNPHVVPYLLGQRRLPRQMPEYIGFGDRNEAVDYVAGFGPVWARAPEAMSWLASVGKRR